MDDRDPIAIALEIRDRWNGGGLRAPAPLAVSRLSRFHGPSLEAVLAERDRVDGQVDAVGELGGKA